MRVFVGIHLALGFATALYFATLAEAQVECHVCLRFQGRVECREAAGADRDAAVRGAVSNACALLARGVTEAFRCDATPPESVSCED